MITSANPISRPCGQPESPGPTGINDSACPDNKRLPPFTPGIIGINDPHVSKAMSDKEDMLRLVKDARDRMEESKKAYVEILCRGHSDRDLSNALQENHRRFHSYHQLLRTYIRDYYHPNETVLWYRGLEWEEVFLQEVDLDRDPDDITVKAAVVEIQVLMLRKACEHYRKHRTKKSLLWVLLLAGETAKWCYETDVELPDEVKTLIHRLSVKRARQTPQQALREHYSQWLESLTKENIPEDIMGLVQDVKPLDPIKMDWLRHQATGI